MGSAGKDGEATLSRAVRALDHKNFDAIPDNLEDLRAGLLSHPPGYFHAAEEMLLRWLLKNMTGNTASAERIRRFPLAWDMMAILFARIPLFSLAKSLADRKFVATLQQTLKEISQPQQVTQTNGADSDVEMTDAPAPEAASNPRKRKRPTPSSFDLTHQKKVEGCLLSAEAVFESIRILLSRCESRLLDRSPNHRMGAEHIKALLSTSASEMMAILVPMLCLCSIAATQPGQQSFHEQPTWISTLTALWDLHIQSVGDVSDVAIHLSAAGISLLGKLTSITRPSPLSVDFTVKERWARDLGRFLTKNLILPSKAVFLNNENNKQNVEIMVELSRPTASDSYPVLFDLLCRSPPTDRMSLKNHELWVQAVVDRILEACEHYQNQGIARVEAEARAAVERVVEMAAERNVSLSINNLQFVCKDFALKRDEPNWGMLLSVIRINPDTFLVSADGRKLLDRILSVTIKPEPLSCNIKYASKFIVHLADGYAKARDLSGFIKVWLKYLSAAEQDSNEKGLWTQKKLLEKVADILEQSLSTAQLLEVLSWLSEQNGESTSVGRLHILRALSAGLKHEEYIDAANLRIYKNALLARATTRDLSASAYTSLWVIAETTLARATLEDVGQIWEELKSELGRALRKSSPRKEETFAVFRCCANAWIANYPDGPGRDEAAQTVCSFIERLESKSDSQRCSSEDISKETYASWILSHPRGLGSLIVERTEKTPELLASYMIPNESEDVSKHGAGRAGCSPLLESETNASSAPLMSTFTETAVPRIQQLKSGKINVSTMTTIQSLLNTPIETLSRPRREQIMKQLVSQLPWEQRKKEELQPDCWRCVLSLMVRLMEMPTFYDGMSFSHLLEVGTCLQKLLRWQKKGHQTAEALFEDRKDLTLFTQFAANSVRQMTSGAETRETSYIAGAVAFLRGLFGGFKITAIHVVLLQVLFSALLRSPARNQMKDWTSYVTTLQDLLLAEATRILRLERWQDQGLLLSLTALEAVASLPKQTVQDSLSDCFPSLLQASSQQLENGIPAVGWEIRTFLAQYSLESLGSPLKIKFALQGGIDGNEEGAIDKAILLQFTDAVIQEASEGRKLAYLEDMLQNDDRDSQSDMLGRLLVIHRLIQHTKGTRTTTPASSADFDLAKAQSILCHRLSHTSSVPEFILLSKSIYLLLDQRTSLMTQWNIELTLSTVTAICSKPTEIAPGWPKSYHWLCQFTGAVIRRHRIRLDGHFHILITALQALLRQLLSRQGGEFKEAHSKLFSRLLTLVCQPTDSSVARSQTGKSGLDSEKDKAKRYAGQYMYLVLMQYIRLQLEYPVTHEVRAALEPGIYSILDITTQDGLRLMNDAMDPSGRVILKELYRQYQKFGKWSGI